MSSLAVLMWRKQIDKRICQKLRLLTEEWEEMQLLKSKTECFGDLLKEVLKEKFD